MSVFFRFGILEQFIQQFGLLGTALLFIINFSNIGIFVTIERLNEQFTSTTDIVSSSKASSIEPWYQK